MDEQKMIKTDINFLEWPNWVVNKKSIQKRLIIEKEHGRYEVFSSLGIPKRFDKIVVYFLLYKLFKDTGFDKYSLSSTRYEIAKNIFGGKHFSTTTYDRIMDALLRWKAITIKFKGVFYEGDRYTIRAFSIIDEFVLDPESGELIVRFSEAYIKQLKESQSYKYVDFNQFKKLHRDLSARLYEILIKTFKDRNSWAISIDGLAEKLTLEKHVDVECYYPSEVLRMVKPALNEINKKTDLHIHLEYNKNNNVCIFCKKTKPKEIIPAVLVTDKKKRKSSSIKDQDACYAIYQNMPEDSRNRIRQAIERDTFLAVLPDDKSKVYAYMKRMNLYPE